MAPAILADAPLQCKSGSNAAAGCRTKSFAAARLV
jgi:hypothetical protein